MQSRWNDEAKEQIERSVDETLAEFEVTKDREAYLRKRLEEYISAPSKFRPQNSEEQHLVAQLQTHLTEHQAAYNEFAERKRQEQFDSLSLGVSELLQYTRELRLEPHIIDSCIKRLPIDEGGIATAQAIDSFMRLGKISSHQGRKLKAISSCLFGLSDEVLLQAHSMGAERIESLTQTLDAVGRRIIGAEAQSLRDIYTAYQIGRQTEQEQMLRLLIKSSLVCLEFDEVYYFYDELLRIAPKAETYAEYARLLQLQNEVPPAITHYKMALELYEQDKRPHTNNAVRTSLIAGIQNNLAILLHTSDALQESEAYYRKALRNYRLLTRGKAKKHREDIAMTLNNLGNLQMKLNKISEAIKHYEQAHRLYRNLYATDEQRFAPELATTLNNLAMATKGLGQLVQAKTYYYDAISLKRSLARQYPDQYQPSLALSLNNLATLNIAQGDLIEAEAHYNESLAIRRELARQNPAAYRASVAMDTQPFGDTDAPNG